MALPWGKLTEDQVKEMFGGLDPKEVSAKLKELEGIKTEVGGIKKTAEDTQASVNSVKELLEGLKLGGKEPNNGEPPNNNNEPPNKGELPKWSEDANAAFEARTAPIVALSLETRGDVVYQRIMNRHKDDWHLYQKEIDKILSESQVGQRANEAYVENVYYVVVGRHKEDIIANNRDRKGTFFVEAPRATPDVPPAPETQLSDKELATAAKLGMTPKDYADSKKSLTIF